MSTQTDTDCCRMKSLNGACPKPLETASAFLSKKWTISLIVTLGNFKRLRFNDLKERLQYATAKTLSDRLSERIRKGRYNTTTIVCRNPSASRILPHEKRTIPYASPPSTYALG